MPDRSTQTDIPMIEKRTPISNPVDTIDITLDTAPDTVEDTSIDTILWLAFDGASRGNPGPSGCGAHAWIQHKDAKKIPFMTMKKSIPPTTNNMAEWKAFVYGLESVCEKLEKTTILPRQVEIRIQGDSRLVVEQTCVRWKIKDKKFMKWFQQAHHLLGQFGKWEMTHVYRQQNTIADELANQAIEERGYL